MDLCSALSSQAWRLARLFYFSVVCYLSSQYILIFFNFIFPWHSLLSLHAVTNILRPRLSDVDPGLDHLD
jgi:hypothetical protein